MSLLLRKALGSRFPWNRSFATLRDSYDHVKVAQTDRVATITLHRPKALNALCDALFADLIHAAQSLDQSESVGCIVLTGSSKAFAAGADIAEMQSRTLAQVYKSDMFAEWTQIAALRKPVIAAVQGYCLGGGCELAMMADTIIAGESAKFGQPEIALGIIPGAGGTQRLVRSIGKAKAMQMVLTGDFVSSQYLETAGLVAEVVPDDQVLERAQAVAAKIASHSAVSVSMAKESINAAYEVPLKSGLDYERRLFHALFGTHDQKEGMRAFLAKEKPEFKHE